MKKNKYVKIRKELSPYEKQLQLLVNWLSHQSANELLFAYDFCRIDFETTKRTNALIIQNRNKDTPYQMWFKLLFAAGIIGSKWVHLENTKIVGYAILADKIVRHSDIEMRQISRKRNHPFMYIKIEPETRLRQMMQTD